MSDETIVAIYDTPAHAELAASDLKAAGIPESAIHVHANTSGAAGATATYTPVREQGFWASLFGGEPDHDTSVYDRSLTSGSTVVTVKTSEAHVTHVMQILESHNPVDIDERAAGYSQMETSTTHQPLGTPMHGTQAEGVTRKSETMQLSEENLVVGKRVVNRGGTRIRRFVVETPVEHQVTLHDEKVTVDRRPVTDGRPVTVGEFGDKTIEMTATAEEAVVSKTARVVEEVALRKEAVDRTETIHDTVRKEEIEVEQVPDSATTRGTTLNPGMPKI